MRALRNHSKNRRKLKEKLKITFLKGKKKIREV